MSGSCPQCKWKNPMINYYLLMKPGILLGNLITVAAGFLLASKGIWDFQLFFATLLGLAFIMASGCVLNNYIDRHLDKKMARTKNRALVTGRISPTNAILFALVLAALGNFYTLLANEFAYFGYCRLRFFCLRRSLQPLEVAHYLRNSFWQYCRGYSPRRRLLRCKQHF